MRTNKKINKAQLVSASLTLEGFLEAVALPGILSQWIPFGTPPPEIISQKLYRRSDHSLVHTEAVPIVWP